MQLGQDIGAQSHVKGPTYSPLFKPSIRAAVHLNSWLLSPKMAASSHESYMLFCSYPEGEKDSVLFFQNPIPYIVLAHIELMSNEGDEVILDVIN